MYQYDILAPRLAESALPGQFVIVKHGEYGERVPLTITDYDREAGTVSICLLYTSPSPRDRG